MSPHPVLSVLGIGRVLAALFDVHALHHVGEAAVHHLANAAGDVAVFRHGVAQEVGDHGVLIRGPVGGEKVIQRPVGARAVKVVGIDDGEGPVHDAAAAEHRVPRAPGLDAPLRQGIALRQPVRALVDVLHVKVFLRAATHGSLEIRLDLLFNNESDAAEARAVSVVEGKVDDRVSEIVDGHDLLETAEAAAHPGSQNHKCRFPHKYTSRKKVR